MRLCVQYEVRADLDFNVAAEQLTARVESQGYLIALEAGEDFTWVGLIEDVAAEDAERLRNRVEQMLAGHGGIEYSNVFILEDGAGERVSATSPLGPRSRPSALAERLGPV